MTKTTQQLHCDRLKTGLKFYMQGAGFTRGLKALGMAERYHVGLRKDGKTPELNHQINICLSITQLKGLTPFLEQRLLVAALLHDVREDYMVPHEEIVEKFGEEAGQDVEALTKKFGDVHKNKDDYISTLSQLLVPSLAKGVDRNDNLESMVGVFKIAKMEQYADEAEKLFLPMLKKASKLYPEYALTYQSIIERMKRNIKNARDYVEQATQVAVAQAATARITELLKSNQVDLAERRHELLETSSKIAAREKHLDDIADGVRAHLDELDEKRKEVEQLKTALKESTCSTKNNKEVFDKVVKIINRFDLPHTTKLNILRQVTLDFGISTLELMHFSPAKVSGDISTT